MKKYLNIALLGNPNCGKTALFNKLTGGKQRVANYAGVTVEKKHGYFITPNNINCTVIDLPGTYSLHSRSYDEVITRNVIFDDFNDEKKIDLILCILDATNLSNGLKLVLEAKQCGKKIIVALNMSDIASNRGYKYDIELLKKEIDCDVIETVAIKKKGINTLINTIDNIYPSIINRKNIWQRPSLEMKKLYHDKVYEIVNKVSINHGTPSLWTDKIDKLILHPIFGYMVLMFLLFVLFQAVFSWSTIPQNYMQEIVDNTKNFIIKSMPNSLFASLLGNGIVAGVGAVLVFLPQIFTISAFIIILEDSGYMSRAAFLMDRLMGTVGLHGKSFIPLLSSFACAIPGILATRTIESKKDRMITILISPLMTCSARLPIYTLLISALIPVKKVWGYFNMQGMVMFALYLSSIFIALIVAFVLKHIFKKNEAQLSLIELPSYKFPALNNLLIELIKPAKTFLKRAGSIIVSFMIVLWCLSSFPFPPPNPIMPKIYYSFVGVLGNFLLPVFKEIGFNWQIVAALIPGLFAREILVSSLGTIYALSGSDDKMSVGLSYIISHTWAMSTGLSLLAWYIVAPQCFSTLAVIKRETNSNIWPIISFCYQFILAYLLSFIVYHIFK